MIFYGVSIFFEVKKWETNTFGSRKSWWIWWIHGKRLHNFCHFSFVFLNGRSPYSEEDGRGQQKKWVRGDVFWGAELHSSRWRMKGVCHSFEHCIFFDTSIAQSHDQCERWKLKAHKIRTSLWLPFASSRQPLRIYWLIVLMLTCHFWPWEDGHIFFFVAGGGMMWCIRKNRRKHMTGESPSTPISHRTWFFGGFSVYSYTDFTIVFADVWERDERSRDDGSSSVPKKLTESEEATLP